MRNLFTNPPVWLPVVVFFLGIPAASVVAGAIRAPQEAAREAERTARVEARQQELAARQSAIRMGETVPGFLNVEATEDAPFYNNESYWTNHYSYPGEHITTRCVPESEGVTICTFEGGTRLIHSAAFFRNTGEVAIMWAKPDGAYSPRLGVYDTSALGTHIKVLGAEVHIIDGILPVDDN